LTITSTSDDAGWPIRRAAIYLITAAHGHFVWEIAQLPLYTIWWGGTAREIAVAVIHCTGGDVLISTATLVCAAILARFRGWHLFGSRMLLTVITLGVAYTMLSEWLNVEVWRSWSYSSSMPVLPWLGTGLSPVLQWLAVPSVALLIARQPRFGTASVHDLI
jgi:hypothetical protein